MATRLSTRASSGLTGLGLVLATGYAGLIAWTANWVSYQSWIALFVVPALLLGNLALIVRVGRYDPDPRFLKLLVAAFLLKMAATAARYLMGFVLYDGVADAAGYHGNGIRLGEAYRQGDFGIEIGRDLVGTGFVRVLTGVLYAATGPSVFVAYAVFSIIGFWGLYFFYRAFRVGIPDGDARRYALVVLLLPSMLFWPSSLGKEAWMTLGIGLTAYACAMLLSGDRRWILPLVAGVASTSVVRPHITAALAVALTIAYLIGRPARPATELTPMTRLLAVSVLLCGLLVVGNHAASFLGVDSLSVSSVDAAIEETTERTDEGGSTFAAERVTSPVDMPRAAVTVLFRPFVFEAGNPQMLLAAAEGSLLLLMFAVSGRRIRSALGRLRRQPYLTLCVCYTLIFVYAFSSFSNFGILTRERVMVLPFALALIALPRQGRSVPSEATHDSDKQGVPT